MFPDEPQYWLGNNIFEIDKQPKREKCYGTVKYIQLHIVVLST